MRASNCAFSIDENADDAVVGGGETVVAELGGLEGQDETVGPAECVARALTSFNDSEPGGPSQRALRGRANAEP